MFDDSGHREQLRSAFLQKKHIAVFSGAGCSDALKIPLWDELLWGLSQKFGPFQTKDELSVAITAKGYPTVASIIQGKVEDPAQYRTLLKSLTQPTSCNFTSLHLELLQLAKTIVTTNYDRSFEAALDCLSRINPGNSDFQYKSHSVGGFSHIGLGDRRNIYHIHGDNDKGQFILTSESYKDQYEQPISGLISILHPIFSEFSVVFVGFSFNDPFFTALLQRISRRIREEKEQYQNGNSPTHFCIMSNDLIKRHLTAAELTTRGIHISDLIARGVLQRSEIVGIAAEPEFYLYNADPEKMPNEKTREFLLKHGETVKTNERKLKLFEEMNIQPIIYPANQFLEIEKILRDINAPGNAVAETYTPNRS